MQEMNCLKLKAVHIIQLVSPVVHSALFFFCCVRSAMVLAPPCGVGGSEVVVIGLWALLVPYRK